jgi:hypothetical protein
LPTRLSDGRQDAQVAKLKTQHVMPGWFRIASGISVIDWSNLASWDGAELEAATDQAAFNLHWPTIDPKFGHWLCWIAFGVGAESIVKGAFGLKNYYVGNFGAAQPWETLKMDENVDFVSKAIHLLATGGLRSDRVPQDFNQVATSWWLTTIP